jgi:hypothetical protein
MKKLQLAIMAAALVMAVQARATLYDITFTGGDGLTTASGQLDVNSGIATSGFLDVTYNGTTIDYGLLWPAGPVIENNNGDETWGSDNIFNSNSTTQGGFLTLNGLILYNETPLGHVGGFVWIGDDSPTDLTPQLAVSGNPPYGFGWFTPITDGNLSVSPAVVPGSLAVVPEPTTMIAGALLLLPFGASALRMLRKNRTA